MITFELNLVCESLIPSVRSGLTAAEIERLHRAFMFKGFALDVITKIVKGKL